MSSTEEELRRSIPDRDYIAGHLTIRICKGARETEIREFDLAVCGYEEIVGFYIAVQDEIGMAEIDRAREHAHPSFDVRSSVSDIIVVFNELFEVSEGEIFQH